MSYITYEQVSEEEGFSVDDLKRGYALFYDGIVEVVQKFDCLEGTDLAIFSNDTEAGKQALKDGYKLFTIEHDDYIGWYILDTLEYREALKKNGFM